MKPKLKICGLMRAEDVRMCCELGVDICGFVTEYPIDVPWNLTREQCRRLLSGVLQPAVSCIVTGGTTGKIADLALDLRPGFVQLHYRETLGDTESIVRTLSPHGIGVIKTIPAAPEERREQFGTADPERCAVLLNEAGVSIILVDARGPSNASGTGASADLSLYRRIRDASECPVMLGGGIRADNCRAVSDTVHPDIIDVMTGAEISPGVKSRKLIEELIDRGIPANTIQAQDAGDR